MSVTVKVNDETKVLVEAYEATAQQHWGRDNSARDMPIGYIEAFKVGRLCFIHVFQALNQNLTANTRYYLGTMPAAFRPVRDSYSLSTGQGRMNLISGGNGSTDIEFYPNSNLNSGSNLAIAVCYMSYD